MENWKDIKGYEGHYMVSDLGRIKSLKSKIIMKPEIMKLGYHRVHISKNGQSEKILIHVLVAQAFLNDKPDGMELNHKDEDKSNNKLSNLEWVTHKENMTKGTVQKRRVEGCKDFLEKLRKPVYQYNIEGELIKKWPSVSAAKRAGYSAGNISMFCNGLYQSALYRGCKWSFKKTN